MWNAGTLECWGTSSVAGWSERLVACAWATPEVGAGEGQGQVRVHVRE